MDAAKNKVYINHLPLAHHHPPASTTGHQGKHRRLWVVLYMRLVTLIHSSIINPSIIQQSTTRLSISVHPYTILLLVREV